MDKIHVNGETDLNTDGSTFQHLLIIDGDMILTSGDIRMELLKGNGILVSADHGDYKLKGHGDALIITV